MDAWIVVTYLEKWLEVVEILVNYAPEGAAKLV
jgi:hypothetical protein